MTREGPEPAAPRTPVDGGKTGSALYILSARPDILSARPGDMAGILVVALQLPTCDYAGPSQNAAQDFAGSPDKSKKDSPSAGC